MLIDFLQMVLMVIYYGVKIGLELQKVKKEDHESK